MRSHAGVPTYVHSTTAQHASTPSTFHIMATSDPPRPTDVAHLTATAGLSTAPPTSVARAAGDASSAWPAATTASSSTQRRTAPSGDGNGQGSAAQSASSRRAAAAGSAASGSAGKARPARGKSSSAAATPQPGASLAEAAAAEGRGKPLYHPNPDYRAVSGVNQYFVQLPADMGKPPKSSSLADDGLPHDLPRFEMREAGRSRVALTEEQSAPWLPLGIFRRFLTQTGWYRGYRVMKILPGGKPTRIQHKNTRATMWVRSRAIGVPANDTILSVEMDDFDIARAHADRAYILAAWDPACEDLALVTDLSAWLCHFIDYKLALCGLLHRPPGWKPSSQPLDQSEKKQDISTPTPTRRIVDAARHGVQLRETGSAQAGSSDDEDEVRSTRSRSSKAASVGSKRRRQ